MRIQCVLGAFALASLLATRAIAADAENDAWTAAMALKAKADYAASAAAFEAIVNTYPKSARVQEACVEAGVGWYAVGKAKQVLHRNTPASTEALKSALKWFDKVALEHPDDPSAARAQYMRGCTHMVLGDLATSEKDFTLAIDKYPNDAKYYGKCLERRAAARRHLLKSALSLEDLQRYQRELGAKGEDASQVQRFYGFTTMCGKPAPALDIETWVQGEPMALSRLHGQVVVLYFFATWCSNCAREREYFLDLVSRYEPMGVTFIGVITHAENTTVAVARPALAAQKYGIPVMMDAGTTAAMYQASKIPEMVLIDRAGNVRWHDHPGNLQDSTLEMLITEDPASSAPANAPTKSH
jgi:peroxiredoxin